MVWTADGEEDGDLARAGSWVSHVESLKGKESDLIRSDHPVDEGKRPGKEGWE